MDGEGERAAPDHTGFASRTWIMSVLLEPNAEHNFGTTEIDGMKPLGKLGADALNAATEFLFAEGHQDGDPPYDAELAARGKKLFENKCMDCHLYDGDGAWMFEGPDMKGYASLAWIEGQVRNPGAESQYGELNEMPAFEEDLDDNDIRMVSSWLRLQRFEKPPYEAVPPAEPQDDDEDGEQDDDAADDEADDAEAE
jgi:ubiquinol-cytochrome c reductase cytochrome b subunit